MAIYRLSAQVFSRAKGRSATAAAAYRAGERIEDERTGNAFDYRAKGGVLHAEIMAPANAPDWMRDRAQLWNAVELAEKRKDAQLCREVQLALPHELTDEQRRDLVQEFVAAEFVSKGMIADVAIHAPDRDSDERNHHAHILLTMRTLTGNGFGPKERAWNDKAELQAWRADWEQWANARLHQAGSGQRIDHRSLEAQGSHRAPTVHEGPAVREMEARGVKTDRGHLNKERRAGNDNIRQLETHIAALDSRIDRLKRMQAIARHAETVWQRAERPAEGRGATSLQRPPSLNTASFEPILQSPQPPALETARMAKDASLVPTRPAAPSKGQEQEGLPSNTGTGPRHLAVNTLAQAKEEIPDHTPEALARYLAARGKFYVKPDNGPPGPDVNQQRRDADGREEERRLEAQPEPHPTGADALLNDLKRRAEERAKQEGAPRDRDRGRERDR